MTRNTIDFLGEAVQKARDAMHAVNQERSEAVDRYRSVSHDAEGWEAAHKDYRAADERFTEAQRAYREMQDILCYVRALGVGIARDALIQAFTARNEV